MEIVVVIVLLLLFARGSSSSEDPLPHSDGGGDHSNDGGSDPLGDVVTAAELLIPLVAGGGGSAAVGGGAAGGSAAGGSAAGGSAAGGNTAGGSTALGGQLAGAGGAVGGSSLVGPITVGLLANPAAWAIYILISSKVVQAQEIDKDFQSQLFALNVSARGLHSFEESFTRRVLELPLDKGGRGLAELVGDALPVDLGLQANQVFRVLQQRDARLDQRLLGSGRTLQGWRSTYRFPWQPGDETLFRRVRYLAIEYLRLRAGHGYRMIRYWKPDVNVPSGWGFVEQPFNTFQAMYEDPTMPGTMPGIGGLLDVPLAADGLTRSPRLNNDLYPNDPLQLRAPPHEAEPINDVTTAELRAVRLAAVLSAVRVVRWDPRPIIDLDAHAYAQDVFNALGTARYASDGKLMTSRTPPEGVSVSGGLLVLDPAVFGTVLDEHNTPKTVAIDPQAIRQTDFGNTRPKVVLL